MEERGYPLTTTGRRLLPAHATRRIVPGPARFTHREFLAPGLPIVAVFAAVYALARQPVDMITNAVNMDAFPEIIGRFYEEGPAAAAALIKQFLALIFTISLPVAVLLGPPGGGWYSAAFGTKLPAPRIVWSGRLPPQGLVTRVGLADGAPAPSFDQGRTVSNLSRAAR